MMGRALLIVGWMATLGILATGIIGYQLADRQGFELHLLLGLASAFLLLFSHCWIMFYLIGTGKAIKQRVEELGGDAAAVEETKRFKNESYPPMMLAMALAMAVFIVGGGVATRLIPVWAHHLLFLGTVVAQLRALFAEHRALGANERLMAEVGSRT